MLGLQALTGKSGDLTFYGRDDKLIEAVAWTAVDIPLGELLMLAGCKNSER